jgi:hypothetical protein
MNSTPARLVFALIGALFGFFAMKVLFGGDAENGTSLRDQLTSDSAMYAVIAEEYPGAFSALLALLSETMDEEDAAEAAFAISSEQVAALRLREAPAAMGAEDALLADYIEASADTIARVGETLGETRCGQFGTLGAEALGPDAGDPRIYPLLDAQAAALFAALSSGRGEEPRPEPSSGDYQAVADQASMSPQEQERLSLVVRQAAGEEGYCKALAWYLRRIARSDMDGAERVRAGLTRQLATS